MTEPLVVSYVQVRTLLQAREKGEPAAMTSPDLGLTQIQVRLEEERVVLPDGDWLSWKEIEEIDENRTACFVVTNNQAEKIQRFSEAFNRFYSLMPTAGAPTLLISGIPMHRIQGTTPDRDTLAKIRTIAPLTGRVLDTATGLGYTAIAAARIADQVVTVELDPAVLEVARLNPWSRRLFDSPLIEQIVGDSFEVVQTFEDQSFARILHDPPMFSLAGDLYSGECYRHMFRILKRKGRLFHYIGDLESRSGRNVVKGVVRRLGEAGFTRIVRRPEAFGVVAYK
jgi:predicted methyltransferase